MNTEGAWGIGCINNFLSRFDRVPVSWMRRPIGRFIWHHMTSYWITLGNHRIRALQHHLGPPFLKSRGIKWATSKLTVRFSRSCNSRTPFNHAQRQFNQHPCWPGEPIRHTSHLGPTPSIQLDSTLRSGLPLPWITFASGFVDRILTLEHKTTKVESISKKTLQKNVPVRKNVPTKAWGFYDLIFFKKIFLKYITLNFHKISQCLCRALFKCWLITSVVKFKVLFLDGPRAQVIFVVNPGLIFSLIILTNLSYFLGRTLF